MCEKFDDSCYERVERYCHVVGKNMSVVRRITGEDRSFRCSNLEECEKNGGCKNSMCRDCSDKS